MHKLVRTTITFAALTLVFGVALSVHAAEPTTLQTVTGGAINILSGGLIPSTVAIPLAQAVSGGSAITAAKDAIVDTIAGAGGSFIGWIGLKGIGYVLFAVSYIAGFIGSTAFTLASVLVTFGLYLNTTILDSEVVQLGWRFCRDLANLGFTIGIVVIAYATMLGYESYGMKNLIKNFVLAAVLVNFSFSIAGFLIDISNMLTNFFVNAALGGGGVAGSWEGMKQFTETLASAFNPQKLLVTSDGLQAYESLKGDGILEGILSVFFVALFTAFAALGMLMVGLTTIWRFAQLSGLIIVMPLAILCYSFPNTRSYYGKWYGKFTCQLTYLPAATFAMYIVIMFVQIKAQVGFGSSQAIDINTLLNSFEQAKGLPGGLTATRTLSLMAAPFQTITNMVLVLTMLFLGITESRNIGCAGGDIALKWAQGLRGWAIGAAAGAPGWAGRKYLSGGGTKPEENRGTRLANLLSGIPLVRRLVPTLNNFAAGTKKNLGNLETQYKGYGDVQLRNAIYNPDIKLSAEDMAAAAKEAVSRGLLNNDDPEKSISQEKLDEFIPALKRYGFEKDILKKAPHLYNKLGLNIEKEGEDYVNKEDGKKFDDAIKAFKAEEVEDLPVEAFEDIEVVRRLSGAQLEKLPKGKEHRAAFTSTVLRLREKIGSSEFDKYMGKTFSKAEAADALTPELLANKDIVRNLTNGHLKRISSPDKKKQRDEFLKTIDRKDSVTGEYIFTEKDLNDFARKNFSKDKDISEIHPDILRNQRIFGKLQGMHVGQLQKEPDTEQQRAVLETLRDEYLNAFADPATLARLDALAAPIVENKTNSSWAIVGMPEGKDAFRVIETDYRLRNPDKEKQKEKTEKQETKVKEKGWWEDDDKGSNPPSTGPKNPPTPPTPPTPPAGGSAAAAPTYTLAPQQQAQPATPPPQPTPAATPQPKPAANKPQRTEPEETEPANSKGPDIGATIDRVFKESTKQPQAEAPKTPLAADLPDDYWESLQAATDTSIPKPTELDVRPITPPELDRLADAEKIRIAKENEESGTTELFIPRPITPESKKSPISEPIDVQFTRITEPASQPARTPELTPSIEPIKRITYQGALTPPEQKPTSMPEPMKTLIEQQKNADKNQISVIPKYFSTEPLKRIAYQGPVTPPPTPTLPEPIRTALQKEKDRKDNQLIRLPKDGSTQERGDNNKL